MRALCYYPDPARLNIEKGHAVFHRLHQYLYENRNNIKEESVKKYCLCAVLFGLRLREATPNFLDENDSLRHNLYGMIKNMKSQLRFPPTMFRGTNLQTIPGDNLNRYVLRFLDYKDTEEDRQAAGGTRSRRLMGETYDILYTDSYRMLVPVSVGGILR